MKRGENETSGDGGGWIIGVELRGVFLVSEWGRYHVVSKNNKRRVRFIHTFFTLHQGPLYYNWL